MKIVFLVFELERLFSLLLLFEKFKFVFLNIFVFVLSNFLGFSFSFEEDNKHLLKLFIEPFVSILLDIVSSLYVLLIFIFDCFVDLISTFFSSFVICLFNLFDFFIFIFLIFFYYV